MNRSTWNGQRALVFARGLYHVAACDGVNVLEQEALEAFIAQLGLPLTLAQLASEPFDYDEAARVFNSSWLRRTFVQAARLMVQMDGEISPEERDTLRAIAVALGVPERIAIDGIEGQQPNPDALVRWIASREIDFVSWDDGRQPAWFWRFPHGAHPLSVDGALVVASGQALVVRAKGTLTDVLEPGQYTLSPDTLPGLAEADGWTQPEQTEFLFVRTALSGMLRWGLSEPVRLQVQGDSPIPVRLFGRFAVRAVRPSVVVQRFAREALPSNDDMESRLRRMVSGRLGQALTQVAPQERSTLKALLSDLDSLKGLVLPIMRAAFASSGFELSRFVIEHLTAPLELGIVATSKRTQTMVRVGQEQLGEGTAPPLGITCGACEAPIAVGARFCSDCGAPQGQACGTCGAGLPARARFCSGCGAIQ